MVKRVWVGIKKCGCLVAVADDRDWLEGDYDIQEMDLEEARSRLKYCKCAEKTNKENKR